MSAPSRSHLPALDGVRGLAILLVLVAHLGVWSDSAADRITRDAALLGFSGVDLFFVLSGFLITRLLWADRETAGRLPRFWIRRALRIFPLYIAATVALFVVLPLLGKAWSEYPMPELWDARWYYWLHATNLRIAAQGTFDLPYNTGHFWSLAVEEQFYLLWPLVVWRQRSLEGLLRVSLWTVAAGLALRIVVGGVLGDTTSAYVLVATRMDGLALGAAIFALLELGRLDAWRPRALGFGLAGIVVMAATVRMQETSAWAAMAMFVSATLVHASLLTLVLTGSSAVVDRGWLRLLGRYSYGLYVIHFPLLLGLAPIRTWARTLPAPGGWSIAGSAAYFAIVGGITLAAAVASYHLYERPFLLLKERLTAVPRERLVPRVVRRA